jgi:hypothetical protein
MTPQERKSKIRSYGKAHTELKQALRKFPKRMWKFKPGPDRWSINEIIVHLADSEANSYIRCRRFIAEPGKPVLGYDEHGWSLALSYHKQNTEEALELFKCLRRGSYNLIKSLPDSVWSNTVEHSESGTMTFERWLEIYEKHTHSHIDQMKKNYEVWKASR